MIICENVKNAFIYKKVLRWREEDAPSTVHTFFEFILVSLLGCTSESKEKKQACICQVTVTRWQNDGGSCILFYLLLYNF